MLFDFHLILGAILLGVPEQLFVGSSPIEVGFPKIDRTAIPSDSYADFSALVRHRYRRVFFHCAFHFFATDFQRREQWPDDSD